ncbi:hypothetical protein QP938_09345 [Porticoccaceae bacterium LTM1]|nr:hypothetical protein QP938_09345 [Porticoccaceae bacterium LTM1]
MKTLGNAKKDIEYWVAELNGYMSAVSHVNDAVGFRHGFWADLIYLEGVEPLQAIRNYIDDPNPKINEIDSQVETQQIREFVFHNFLLGKEFQESEETNFILNQFIWHIQDYISLASGFRVGLNRWLYRCDSDDQSSASIFIHIKGYIAVMNFHWRIEHVDV